MTAIVVPIFNAVDQARRCLTSLADHLTHSAVSVIVVDDASTSPDIAVMFNDLPADWVLVRNETNIGFVGSANLGLSLAGREDVVLLNSDTQVSSGWLSALLDCAASDGRIASITPLTNHGELASVPEFCRPNPWPKVPESWARAARESGPAQYPELPTAIGFCMFLRRACIDEIGGFDEVAFGRGYGEENDWCCRATAAGWRHVLCDHAFVAHEGGASFGPLGLKPGGQAMETLLSRHPDYLDRVKAFIEADPFAERRRCIVDCHRRLADA